MEMSNENHQCKRIYDPNINAYNKLNRIAPLTAPYSYQTYAIPNVNDSSDTIPSYQSVAALIANDSSDTIPSYQSVAALIANDISHDSIVSSTVASSKHNKCNESIIATPIPAMSFTAAAAESYSNAILTETAV
eukprot:136489_1